MEPIDIRDQYVLTKAITKLIRPETFVGSTVAPIVPSSARKFKMTVREADQPFGIGQFKAPNEDSPIARVKQTLNSPTVVYVTAVDLEEMDAIEETDLLESADALVRAGKIDEIIKMGALLQLRNERLTEWMRWKAFQDALTITFAGGGTIAVESYGDTYKSGAAKTHVWKGSGDNARCRASYTWDNPDASKVLDDLRTWSDILEADGGYPATHVFMRRSDYRSFQKSAQFKDFLTFLDRSYRIVTPSDISALVDIPNWHVYEGSWKNRDGTLQYYIPEGYALLTSDPMIAGQNIGEMYDCPVVRYVGGRLVVSRNPGMVAETWVDPLKKQEFLRVSTARMIQLIFPECFMWLKLNF